MLTFDFRKINLPDGAKVLDVGCGAGTQAFHLKGLYNHYIGVDYAEKLIEVGRKITKNCVIVPSGG